MRKVEIGTSNYTEVFSENAKTFNSYHQYEVRPTPPEGATVSDLIGEGIYAKIKFQEGPIKEYGINGCHNEDLIAIVIDRLQNFQESSFACRENAIAITKLEEALLWLGKRTQDRRNKGIEGTSQI